MVLRMLGMWRFVIVAALASVLWAGVQWVQGDAGGPAKTLVMNLNGMELKPISSTAARAGDDDAGKPAAAYKLADLGFLQGAWQDSNPSGHSEEHWSGVYGKSMMGMFRWCKPDGTPAMFEILTLTEEPEGLMLRLRHFSAKLAAKEDKDAPVTLKLARLIGQRAVFEVHSHGGSLASVTYDRVQSVLNVTVEFAADAKRPPLKFAMQRQGEAARQSGQDSGPAPAKP